jgi:hypothetical protein
VEKKGRENKEPVAKVERAAIEEIKRGNVWIQTCTNRLICG